MAVSGRIEPGERAVIVSGLAFVLDKLNTVVTLAFSAVNALLRWGVTLIHRQAMKQCVLLLSELIN